MKLSILRRSVFVFCFSGGNYFEVMLVVPLLALDSSRWRLCEKDFFWFCAGGLGERVGIWAGDGSCCYAAAVYGVGGFAGRGGEDDAVVACRCAGGFGRGGC